VIRGGYGIYGSTPILGANQLAPNLGWDTSASFSSPDGGVSPAFILQNGFPSYPLGGNISALTSAFGAVPVGQTTTTSPSFVDRNWQMGYTQNFTLSIERQLSPNMLLEIAGQGVLGRRLADNRDLNEVPPQSWGMPGPNFARRPFPQFNQVTQLKYADGVIDYYAGWIRLEKRFSRGLSLYANYDWNKNLGLVGRPAGSIYFPQLSRGPAIEPEIGGSPDTPEQMGLIGWVYELPWGPKKRFVTSGLAAKILGGWDVSGVLTLSSGVPFSITSGTDSLNGNSPLGNRVNIVGNPHSGLQNPDHWFNTAAFAIPAFGTIGNAGPGILYSPGQEMLNFSIGKNAAINERLKMRFSADFFNLTNTIQWGVPNTSLSDPNYGRILGPLTTPGTPGGNGEDGARIVQLGLRFEF
jgi:hypothetical protein